MKKFEAATLEDAMQHACDAFGCSITELQIEVVQHPKSGMLGMFKKQAIIIAMQKVLKSEGPALNRGQALNSGGPARPAPKENPEPKPAVKKYEKPSEPSRIEDKPSRIEDKPSRIEDKPSIMEEKPKKVAESKPYQERGFVSSRTDIITPTPFVTAQDDYEEYYEEDEFKPTASRKSTRTSKEEVQNTIAKAVQEEEFIKRINTPKNDVENTFFQSTLSMDEMIEEIEHDINNLFSKACFTIDPITVKPYDDYTVLVEFTGEDAALLIGKEGYRYKALSYMLFNWINAKYGLQLRLEIAEFLKNQEEMVSKYLENVYLQVEQEGRAQTKILDGVLVQIALKKLRASYPDKYVGIRTNREGLKYIIINSFRTYNG